MRLAPPTIVAAVLVLAAIPQPLAASAGPVEEDGPLEPCPHHEPILITETEGGQGFVLDGHGTDTPVYRPGSGVVGGSGTEEDPYRIAGWCLTTHGGTNGITLRGTETPVVVEDNHLYRGATSDLYLQYPPYIGVVVEDATK